MIMTRTDKGLRLDTPTEETQPVAVNTRTPEEFDLVTAALGYTWSGGSWRYHGAETCISTINQGIGTRDTYERLGYTIAPTKMLVAFLDAEYKKKVRMKSLSKADPLTRRVMMLTGLTIGWARTAMAIALLAAVAAIYSMR